MTRNRRASFRSNLAVAFLAQGVSLLMSVMMSIVVPKVLGVAEYGYWQLFIFYVGYVGFFHFGFNDGLYLRLGGKEYDALDFGMLGTELRVFSFSEVTLAFMIALYAVFFVANPDRRFILILASAYMVLNNLALYFGYVFQAVNQTKVYSYSVMIDRTFVLFLMVALILSRKTDYMPYAVAYTLCKLVSLVYCLIKGRRLLSSGGIALSLALRDMWENVSVGMKLMVANIASMLILGTGRIVIDNVWGIETFGKISLSLTITHFFLLFVQQASMVLFPALKRMDRGSMEALFVKLKKMLGTTLPVVLVAYVPMRMLLDVWLPQYAESLKYFAVLLPICLFDGKMQMLYNTWFKAMREERGLLLVNVVSLAMSVVLTVLGGFVLGNLFVVILSMLLAIAFRSIVAESMLSSKMGMKTDWSLLLDVAYVAIFIVSAWFCKPWTAFLTNVAAYLAYLLLAALKSRNQAGASPCF